MQPTPGSRQQKIYSTLISAQQLDDALPDSSWAIVDCRFSLADPEIGRAHYLEGHIPGAVYAHLEEDLSGPIIPGTTGRHPLPDVSALSQRLGQLGIENGAQVVAYDDSTGAMAARFWWMLHWLGHEAVAVLDGGFQAWVSAGHRVRAKLERRDQAQFSATPQPELVANMEDIVRRAPGTALLDARGPDRFQGEVEPIDPVAGHIAGAINAHYRKNLNPDGSFRSQQELRDRFEALLGSTPSSQSICYCGSGVTATHNILAMKHAGLPIARLYPGSWSEWVTRPENPTATGP